MQAVHGNYLDHIGLLTIKVTRVVSLWDVTTVMLVEL